MDFSLDSSRRSDLHRTWCTSFGGGGLGFAGSDCLGRTLNFLGTIVIRGIFRFCSSVFLPGLTRRIIHRLGCGPAGFGVFGFVG